MASIPRRHPRMAGPIRSAPFTISSIATGSGAASASAPIFRTSTPRATSIATGLQPLFQSIFAVTPTLHLKVRGGYAYRNYFDFPGNPSRNTNVLRGNLELRKYFDNGLSAAIYSNYDKFASRNENYDSERFINGAMMSWEY